ncbi:MAG TPA: hydrogenase 4 subunit F [Methanomassiliicoccales archaeon]|nr:hydrogenase 4 subunit F [Methanomassiliicoccales archaeon]
MLELLVAIPIVSALLCYLAGTRRAMEVCSALGTGVLLAVSIALGVQVFGVGAIYEGTLFLDSFGAFALVIVAFIGLMTSLYSIGYMGREHEEGEFPLGRLRLYYALLNGFIFTMVLVTVSNNLGVMWIAIEGTTLASAFLVGFYNRETSLEAAWKYVIICSVGITLALLGIILAYASSTKIPGIEATALDWTTLMNVAPQLDPTLLKVAFIMVLVGYGTKVGLAPMHTWLPDAHSQAPTPVSALLSGVLLNCAMYGILRLHLITSASIGPGFSGTLLLAFGVLSLAVAAIFIILARDYKRLLAYSSIEHMGIIAIGFGIGGPFGVLGGLLHMLNHAVTKSMLFFTSGNILLRFKTKAMEEVRGLGTSMPLTALFLVLGALAITGSPPFSIFISEFTVVYGGLQQGQYIVVGLMLLFLVVIFAAFLWHVLRMVFGNGAKDKERGEVSRSNLAIIAAMMIIAILFGLYLPDFLGHALDAVVHLFQGAVP